MQAKAGFARTLFIGHAYHSTTKSSYFFKELLLEAGSVEVITDNSLDGFHEIIDYREKVASGGYTLVVVWQLEHVAEQLRGFENVVFVPMYDGCRHLPSEFWKGLQGMRVLAFSIPVFEIAQTAGCKAQYCQYWPNAAGSVELSGDTSSAYFWYRRNDLPYIALRSIIERQRITKLTVLWKPDPSELSPESKEDLARRVGIPVEFEPWMPTKEGQFSAIGRSAFFIASRDFEGIGLSFLEAMALGRCVIAPRNPTYTDYIISGFNGILYDLDYCYIPSREEIGQIRQNAAKSARAGFKRWKKAQPLLLNWLLSGESFDYWGVEVEDDADADLNVQTRRPRLSVVTVVRNSEKILAETIENVLSQRDVDFEYVILDGASTDGTLEVASRYRDRISKIVSEPDRGIYDAMNKAANIVSGDYILFMNAGDAFLNTTVLKEMMRDVPDQADFVVGHHIYRRQDGVVEVSRVADFRETFDMLKKGKQSGSWLKGVPCHQATITRTDLLRNLKYDTTLFVAADHDLMYRAAAGGAKFLVRDCYVALYDGGGFSSKKRYECAKQWLNIALKHSENPASTCRFYSDHVLEPLWADLVASKGVLQRVKLIGRESGTIFKLIVNLRLKETLVYLKWAAEDTKARLVRRAHRKGVVDLRNGQRSDSVHLAGFSFPEEEGSWTDGARARIELQTQDFLAKKIRVHISKVHHYFKKPIVEVVVNSDLKFDLKVKEGPNDIVLGEECIVEAVELFVPLDSNAVRAASNGDRRKLGLMIGKLEFLQ